MPDTAVTMTREKNGLGRERHLTGTSSFQSCQTFSLLPVLSKGFLCRLFFLLLGLLDEEPGMGTNDTTHWLCVIGFVSLVLGPCGTEQGKPTGRKEGLFAKVLA